MPDHAKRLIFGMFYFIRTSLRFDLHLVKFIMKPPITSLQYAEEVAAIFYKRFHSSALSGASQCTFVLAAATPQVNAQTQSVRIRATSLTVHGFQLLCGLKLIPFLFSPDAPFPRILQTLSTSLSSDAKTNARKPSHSDLLAALAPAASYKIDLAISSA